VPVLRLSQVEVGAERIAFILLAERTASLEDRHDPIDEQLQLSRQRLEDDEAVRAMPLEPGLERVRHPLGRADEGTARGCEPFHDLAQRQLLGG
jgi:hypothetical protein